MTPADRIRAAVEAALPCTHRCIDDDRPDHWSECRKSAVGPVLAAVLPLVEELERDRERLDWLLSLLNLNDETDGDVKAARIAHEIIRGKQGRAAIDAARATEADDEG